MLRVLKTGKPANWGAKKDEKEWALAMEEDEFPEGFDAHLFSHVLHDWDFSDVKLKANAIQYLKWKNYWRGRAFPE